MPDQDYAVLAVFLCSVLLLAVVVPAPSRPPRHEAGVHLTLLGAGAALAILAGVLALAQLPAHSAGAGMLAWLTVLPCVWMARGPRAADGYGEEEQQDEDDDGGEPWPRLPGAPPSPHERRPERGSPGLAGARVAWARPAAQRAPAAAHLPHYAMLSASNQPAASTPAASAPVTASDPYVAPISAPEPLRLTPSPRGRRADHRTVVHKRTAQRHGARRRRASLRHRALDRCRSWLWVKAPECVTFVEAEHDNLRRQPGSDRRHAARSAPLH